MLTFIRRTTVLALCIFAVSYLPLWSQPPHKAKERIEQIKKMKLLDILNLDEAAAEKFITKYTTYENKVNEKRQALDEVTDELQKSVRKKESKDDVSKLTKSYLDLQKQFFDAIADKTKAMSSILNEEEYAKFLIFENEFPKELQKVLFEKKMKDKGRKRR
jgi:hypothetical protein